MWNYKRNSCAVEKENEGFRTAVLVLRAIVLIEKYIRRTNSFIDNNGSSRCDRVYNGVFCGVYIIDLKNFNKHWKLHEML